MTTSEMVRELCRKKNISILELARSIGQSPQNFNKKLQRGTVFLKRNSIFDEMLTIANELGIKY